MKSIFDTRRATNLEVLLITLVFVCLPLFEAPKNIFSALYLVVWLCSSVRYQKFGRASCFELPLIGLAAVLWIAPLYSEFGDVITPLNSAPRWTFLALFVLAIGRLDYSYGQAKAIIIALIVGGVAAVMESLWVWSINGKSYPEFRSVGHVNHSSMYSLITLAAGIGARYLYEWWLKVLGVVAIISTLAFLLPSKSLVGGVAVMVILMAGLAIWAVRRRTVRSLAIAVFAVVVVLAGTLATPPAAGFRGELVARVTGEDIFSHRDKILNSALAVWDRHPLLGTGWFSFGVATSEEEVRAVLAEKAQGYDPNSYAHMPHGHNLWTTMLIERGLLGVALSTALLYLYFRRFLPLVQSREHLAPNDHGIAVAALLVAVGFAVAGLGNTTMMNEHGHAGMALVAVCYGYLRGRGLVGETARV